MMMKNRFFSMLPIALALTWLGWAVVPSMGAQDIPRINKEKLEKRLGDPDVIILDVRHSEDWQKSGFKIKGAIRRRPTLFDSWANEFSPDRMLVLY